MITVTKHGVILAKTNLPFESDGVLNPAIYQDGSSVHIFYRALGSKNHSTIGYAKLEGPLTVVDRKTDPLLISIMDYESHGVEDARIVKIDDLFYLSYTAYNGINALGAFATSADLVTWERQGIIVPRITYKEFETLGKTNTYLVDKYQNFYTKKQSVKDELDFLWDKNVIFFPRKINNKFCFLHRILPEIQLVMVDSFSELTKDYWQNYFLTIQKNVALSSKYAHEISYVGGGCPPIETSEGWVIIYHGVHDVDGGHIYNACVSLHDLDNPLIELSRLPYALFEPDTQWELKGVVNNVVFPTGTALFDDKLYIYYGAADKCIACASLNFKELISELVRFKT